MTSELLRARRRLAAAATTACTAAAVFVALTPTTTAAAAPVATAGATASAAAAVPGGVAAAVAVDPGDRASVIAGYQQTWLPTQSVPSGWTGSTATCTVGADSAAADQATLTAVNFVRALAGRPAVTMDPALSAKALPAALMQDANNALSHTPPSTWRCYTADGATGSGKSNLFLNNQTLAPGQAVATYMTDPGGGNEFVGHRRWILYSRQARIGTGTTTRANALYVLDSPSFLPEPAGAAFAAWPAAGYFPGQLEPGGRWSFSQAGADFTNATVTVTEGGRTVPATVIARTTNGYGDNTVSWSLAPGWDPTVGDTAFTVTVAGYRNAAGTVTSTRYRTTLVDGTEGMPDRNVITFAQPGAKVYGQTATLRATNSQGLRVYFYSTTTSVCTTPFTTPPTVKIVGVGTCSVSAYVGHDDRYPDAAQVSRSFAAGARPLTVTAPSVSRAFGAANPTFRPRLTGWAAGESATSSDVTGRAACRTSATAASPRGTYPIRCTQGTLASGGHYTFTFVNGTLTVT